MRPSGAKTHSRSLDIICLGRAAVDLYGHQVGSRLEDMSSFAKYLGGSSCNIAFGCARLGLKSAMLTRVGDEHMGRFVREELDRGGVDVSHVVTDPDRLTGLVILGIKDSDTFPLIFFRRDCADMAVDESDFSAEFIAASKALLITGTHFSTEKTHAASMKAIEYARASGVRVIVDIDYRPVLWGLTGLGDGETRYIDSDTVTSHLRTIWPHCDLIVGTDEEVRIAGGSRDTIAALQNIRSLTDATIVLKLGGQGCAVFDGDVPASLEDVTVFPGPRVEVLNVLGAGDAFLSGFLRGWLGDEDYRDCAAYANACGALVVARHGCSLAIPTAEELDYYMRHAEEMHRPDLDPELNYLHRVTTRHPKSWPQVYGLAFDHRQQLVEMAHGAGADLPRIAALKRLIVRAVEKSADAVGADGTIGVIIDDTFGQDALNDVTGRGWWIARPVEQPGSRPLELDGGRSIGDRLRSWPLEHVVKCLVYYSPDDDLELRLQQERQLKELYNACCTSGHELLLEIIPPGGAASGDGGIAATLQRLYNLDIRPDWWKLPPVSRATWLKMETVIAQRAPHCRGVVMLGLDAPMEELKAGFDSSAGISVCRGFTIGRTIFASPAREWLAGKIDDDELIGVVSRNYVELIDCWRNRKAG